MTIQFDCDCGKHFSVPDTMAGTKARCKQCGEIVTIPSGMDELVELEELEPLPPAPARTAPTSAPKPAATAPAKAAAKLVCPSCGKQYPWRAEFAGKQVSCAACKTTFTATAPATPAVAPKEPVAPDDEQPILHDLGDALDDPLAGPLGPPRKLPAKNGALKKTGKSAARTAPASGDVTFYGQILRIMTVAFAAGGILVGLSLGYRWSSDYRILTPVMNDMMDLAAKVPAAGIDMVEMRKQAANFSSLGTAAYMLFFASLLAGAGAGLSWFRLGHFGAGLLAAAVLLPLIFSAMTLTAGLLFLLAGATSALAWVELSSPPTQEKRASWAGHPGIVFGLGGVGGLFMALVLVVTLIVMAEPSETPAIAARLKKQADEIRVLLAVIAPSQPVPPTSVAAPVSPPPRTPPSPTTSVVATPAPPPTPTSTSSAPDGKRIDLLRLVQLPRDATQGAWRAEGSHLVSPADRGKLTIPYDLPQEYTIAATIERLGGDHWFMLGVVGPGTRGHLFLDLGHGTDKEPWHSGIELIAGRGNGENGTRVLRPTLPLGKAVKVVCAVRASGIAVDCDGQRIIDWKGDPRDLSTWKDWNLPISRQLIVATNSSFRISQLEVAGAGSATTPVASARSLDLLRNIQLSRDAKAGTFRQLPNGSLVIPEGGPAYLNLETELPREYELELKVERTQKGGGLGVGLLVEGRRFMIEVDGKGTGIHLIDGKWAVDNPTKVNRQVLTNGRVHTLVFTVHKAGVKLAVDGQSVIDWRGNASQLSMPDEWDKSGQAKPFLGAWGAEYRIDKAELRALTTDAATPAGTMDEAALAKFALDGGGHVSHHFDRTLRAITLKRLPPGGLAALAVAAKLEELGLWEIKDLRDADLAPLARFETLEEVNLLKVPLTGEGFVHLSQLPNLREISLHCPQANAAHLVHLKGLDLETFEAVDLQGEMDLAPLAGHTNLSSVAVWRTPLKRGTLAALKGCPLTSLRLINCGLVDSDLAPLADQTKLYDLHLPNGVVLLKEDEKHPKNALTDACLPHLARLEKLTYLDLSRSTLSDAGMTQVGKFTKLEILDLKDVGITDAGIARLSSLTVVESLWLSGSSVTDASFETFKNLPKLKTLDLAHTKATKAGKDQFRLIRPMVELW